MNHPTQPPQLDASVWSPDSESTLKILIRGPDLDQSDRSHHSCIDKILFLQFKLN